MRFATYLPCDWRETTRSFRDYCSLSIGKEAIFCIPADTLEDFVLGSLSIEPVCPEQLIIFEVKRFYWVDKTSHYLYLQNLQRAEVPKVMDSKKMVEMLSEKENVTYPYQEFTNWYRDVVDKTKLEFLVPKDRIKPIKIIDVKKAIDDFFFKEENHGWPEFKKAFVDQQISQYYGKDLPEDMSYERCVRNLEALICFQNFITNRTIIDVANEIYSTTAIYGDMDKDVYWKLRNKLNDSPSEQRLERLIKYIKQFIQYE